MVHTAPIHLSFAAVTVHENPTKAAALESQSLWCNDRMLQTAVASCGTLTTHNANGVPHNGSQDTHTSLQNPANNDSFRISTVMGLVQPTDSHKVERNG